MAAARLADVAWLRPFEPKVTYKPCVLVAGVIFALRVKLNERCRLLFWVKSSSSRATEVDELSNIFTALLPDTFVTIAPRVPNVGLAGLTEVQPVGLEPGVPPVKSSENMTCPWLEQATRHAAAMSEIWSFIGLILLVG